MGNPIPSTRGAFVDALGRLLGKVQLARHAQRNRTIEKRQSQPLSDALGYALAPGSVRR
jgi:hypothetical protein